METIQNNYCGNCHYPIEAQAKYCQHCGQKNTDGRLTIRSFFAVLFSTIFNLESKFFQTIADIFIPGKLTIEYFKGRHKRYFHPVRFFIVTALLMIAIIGFQANGEKKGMFEKTQKKATQDIYFKQFLADYDSLSWSTCQKFPNNLQLKPAFDSLQQKLSKNVSLKDSIDLGNFVIISGFEQANINISNEDFINLSPEELVKKYKITGFWDCLFFKQKVKLFKDNGSMMTFFLSNSIWVILLMMPLLALILKLIYIRRDYFYVEHLVFSFHTHSFLFLLLTFALVIEKFVLKNDGFSIFAIFFMLIYLYLALRRVYGQSRVKTIFKLIVLNIAYLFIFLLCLLLGFLSGFALF